MAVHSTPDLPDGKPVVGQSIHFVSDGGVCNGALVTGVDGTDPYKISLRYFTPDSSYWQQDVSADLDTLTDGTWHAVGVN
jgi:hypothetical protein